MGEIFENAVVSAAEFNSVGGKIRAVLVFHGFSGGARNGLEVVVTVR